MKIKSIRRIESPPKFVDITVANNHNFFANGMLTHNCSLPARNVIILGTKRGIQEVDTADIIQEAGRAGRLGLDPEGTCHLICEEPRDWKRRVANPPEVSSKLLVPKDLRFQVLTEIHMRSIKTVEDLEEWFKKTLACQQVDFPVERFKKCVMKLAEWKLLTIEDNHKLSVTELGTTCIKYYFTPDDVHHWQSWLYKQKELDDHIIAIMIGCAPSLSMGYIPAQYKGNVSVFHRRLTKNDNIRKVPSADYLFMSYVVHEHLHGEADDKGLGFYTRSFIRDADRISAAITQLGKFDGNLEIENLEARLKYGVPAEIVWLCKYPGIGSKRAYLLWVNGIRNPDDLCKMDLGKLGNIVGKAVAKKLTTHLKESV